MLFKRFLIIMFLFWEGCASLDIEESVPQKFFLSEKKVLTNVSRVREDMSYQEVQALMGDEILTGYQKDPLTNQFEPMKLKNPYRIEILQRSGQLYNIVYYFTKIKNSDGIISDEELTPLIFKNNQLMAQGWDSLFALRNKGFH